MNLPLLIAGKNGQPPKLAPRLFVFDGHKFDERAVMMQPGFIPAIYMAAKARAGDATAVAMLNAFEIRIRDSEGRMYWPMPDAEPAAAQPSEPPAAAA